MDAISPIAGTLLPIERAEELLQTLPGVLNVRIVSGPTGEVSEVHILTTTEVSPKQTVRNVESALLAHLGMRVSHKKISVATSEGPAAEAFRAARMATPALSSSPLTTPSQGMQAIAHWGDFVGGSFVRSARTLKYNPAEMEYVRERMAAVSMHQMTAPMQMTGNAIRQQANAMKGQPGVTQEQVDEMLKQADEMDKATAPSPATQQNLNALRQARPNVSQQQWMNIGMAGGGMGLLALTGLGDPADTATARKLTEFRTLYTDALNNKTSAGMEDKKPEN